MGNLKDILIGIGAWVLLILVVATLLLGFYGFNYGIQRLWSSVPFGVAGVLYSLIVLALTLFLSKRAFPKRRFEFTLDYLNQVHFLEFCAYITVCIIISFSVSFGIAGFLCGLTLILITFFFSKSIFPKRRFELTFDYFNKLHFLEIISYLYGFVIISAAICWFFLPNTIIQALPSFRKTFSFSIIAVFSLYCVGGCLAKILSSLRSNILAKLFYGMCAILGLLVINFPIWNLTERLPNEYYFLSKILFAFIFFLQMLYLSFLHIFPAFRQYKRQKRDC